jgi:hypothetical protein
MNRKTSQDRYADQCNPKHASTGPGHPHGYQGSKEQDDLDNHSNQKNSNNWRYLPQK